MYLAMLSYLFLIFMQFLKFFDNFMKYIKTFLYQKYVIKTEMLLNLL